MRLQTSVSRVLRLRLGITNVLNRLKVNSKDDVLIIDFGINDSVSSSNKITVDEMEQYMSEMAAMAKEKVQYLFL